MIALIRAVCLLHFAEQRVHFIKVQNAVGTDCAVARHGGKNFVPMLLKHLRPAKLPEVIQNVADKLRSLVLNIRGDHSRNGTEREMLGRRRSDIEPEALKLGLMLLVRRHLKRIHGKNKRNQKLLRRDAGGIHLTLQFFVADPFVGRVHINNHKALAVFGEHINAADLRERAPERERIFVCRNRDTLRHLNAARMAGRRADGERRRRGSSCRR